MKIQISESFNYSKLLRFTLPSMAMMVFTSIYGVVDGFFVSNFAGKQAFAAVNLAWPVIMILGTLGMMFGTGGSALVAAAQGRGRRQLANEYFSLIVYAAIVTGFVLVVLGFLFFKPFMRFMGATGGLLDDSVFYGYILVAALPVFILQAMFQTLFITAGKPNLGLYTTLAAGIGNMVLDFLLVGALGFGLGGAAAATVGCQVIGGFIPLVYFARKNGSTLKLGRAKWVPEVLVKTCSNGISELLSGISGSLISVLYNYQLIKYAGENGVAAFGVIMYVTFVFFGIFIGYANGSAPITSFNYGAKNRDELKNLFRMSLVIVGLFGLAMFAIAQLTAPLLAQIFVGYDKELFDMTVHAFRITSASFLISGFSIYGSSLFTALNNGIISAVISVSRTVILEVAAVMLLPIVFGVDGVWFAVWVTEIAAIVLTTFFVIRKRKVYGYL